MNQVLPDVSTLPWNVSRHWRGSGSQTLFGALETTTPARIYHWDGLQRGGNARHPTWLFQCTLSGRGFFQTGRTVHHLQPGQAFSVRIPSAHRYWSDPQCPEWRFFWVMVQAPLVTKRIFSHPNLVNGLLTFHEPSPVLEGAVSLLRHLIRQDARDDYQMEEHLFGWMLECERWADEQRHPVAPKTRLLETVRRYVRGRLTEPVRIPELARVTGRTRSNFSHYFRRVTGQTPAAYVLGLRLDEAARHLRASRLSVKEVAAATGFSSSHQFGKSFRRVFRMSPGNYRALHATR